MRRSMMGKRKKLFIKRFYPAGNYTWIVPRGCTSVDVFLVGGAPNFKEDFEGDIHELGAICCIVGSQLWVMFNCPWCLLVWVAYVVYTIVMMTRHVSDSVIADFYRTKPMFWVEIAALLATYMSVFILI